VGVPVAVVLAAIAAASLRLPWRGGSGPVTGWVLLGPPLAPAVAAIAGLTVFALVMHYLPGHLPAEQDPARPRWAAAAHMLAALAGTTTAGAGLAVVLTGPSASGPWTALLAGLGTVAVCARTPRRQPGD